MPAAPRTLPPGWSLDASTPAIPREPHDPEWSPHFQTFRPGVTRYTVTRPDGAIFELTAEEVAMFKVNDPAVLPAIVERVGPLLASEDGA